jgi:membrane-bound lytic murein transglycosylase B
MVVAALILTAMMLMVGPVAANGSFSTWLTDLRAEARKRAISESTLDAALGGLRPIPRVVELDLKQPEFTQTFWAYLDKRVSANRIELGRELLAKHRDLLEGVRRRFGVQPRFLLAIWGLESNFGSNMGDFPIIASLATLAYDGRRGAFFRSQLLDALQIIDEGNVTSPRMYGSWAGAMGQPQFMPSTFVRYAVDYDEDGRRDIWGSLPDVLASAANFLSDLGWRGDETWGREVRLPPDFDWELADLETEKKIADWRRLGVQCADGGDLPQADMAGSIILPAGHQGPAFLVYRNFRAILGWNRSLLYALAVGHLADRIDGKGPLFSARPNSERPLSRGQVEELQTLLARLGFDPGQPDGVVGRATRDAIRRYQRSSGTPPDGHASFELLAELRVATVEPPVPSQ